MTNPTDTETDPLATVPAEERTRILEAAQDERDAAYAKWIADDEPIAACEKASERAYLDTIAREVAAWHAAHPAPPSTTPETLTREGAPPVKRDPGAVREGYCGIVSESRRAMICTRQPHTDGEHVAEGVRGEILERWTTPAEPESDDPLADLLLVLPPRDLVAARAEIAARREIIASAPGQTPIARAPSTIAAAFEAILAFFICLIGPRPHRKITPAEEIGALAACEVETDFTPDSPPTDLTRLRDLIQCAAEEYAQIRADASKRLDRVAASRRERKAADLAAGRVTEEELREIDARTSGPGPLAGDGALLRRCAAEIRRLTAKLAGIEGVAAQGDGMMAKISEQAAEIERLRAEMLSDRGMYEAQIADLRNRLATKEPSR